MRLYYPFDVGQLTRAQRSVEAESILKVLRAIQARRQEKIYPGYKHPTTLKWVGHTKALYERARELATLYTDGMRLGEITALVNKRETFSWPEFSPEEIELVRMDLLSQIDHDRALINQLLYPDKPDPMIASDALRGMLGGLQRLQEPSVAVDPLGAYSIRPEERT